MNEQYYNGHGKLLLTGEYFVLDGAKSLALPTKLGQRMRVTYRPSNNPKIFWKSYDTEQKVWFETVFELWHFDILENDNEKSQILKGILTQARKQNIHFLRDDVDVYVDTYLDFPTTWGLGSSSTLVYNIAQWAYISPFELLAKAFGGSGYDIACAQYMGPITYQIQSRGPHWETVSFMPHFKDQIYFLYLNKKQNSKDGIKHYKEQVSKEEKSEVIKSINHISDQMLQAIDLKEFEDLVYDHENLISKALDLPRVKDLYFNDYWGAVKSLGAWGGDFALVTSNKSQEETQEYFKKRGFETLLTFDELILQNFQKYGAVADQETLEFISAPN